MTQDEIIEMAREAGALQISFNQTSMQYEYSMFSKQIVDFARLVADKECEECAKLCEDLDRSDWQDRSWDQGTYDCAAEIRARGETTLRGEA